MAYKTDKACASLVWCRLRVDSEQDERFVALLRQSHVMPFVPLRRSESDEAAAYAVLQPIDGIAPSTLAHFPAAHKWRASHQGWGSGGEDTPEASDVEALRPQDPRKQADTPLEQVRTAAAHATLGPAFVWDGCVSVGSTIAPIEARHSPSAIQQSLCCAAEIENTDPVLGSTPACMCFEKRGMQAAAVVWQAPEAQQGADEKRVTGFLVHAVRLEDIMKWCACHLLVSPSMHVLLSFSSSVHASRARPPRCRTRELTTDAASAGSTACLRAPATRRQYLCDHST